MLKSGQTLFEYEIIRPLGQGGFGAVFEAHDRMLNRRVAIKQLNPDKVTNEKAIKRFIQEARIIASMNHPNLISTYALRGEEAHLYMIMEYISGGTLGDLLDEHGKLSVDEAVRLTIGICEGLAVLHEKNIIHRDIKPSNILITHDGRPKVIDFGIAHVPNGFGGMAITQAGFQPSTLLYSSPEQVGGEPLDPRSDVYQIGEMLYYMLTGRHYIDIDTIEQEAYVQRSGKTMRSMAKLYDMLERAICQDMPAGLKTLWREVGSLAGVVERAMVKNKLHRFRNAAEFAATLKTLSLTSVNETSSEDLTLQNSRVYNQRGLSHAHTRNYEQAIVDYNRAIELDPLYADAYNNRSAAHLQISNYSQAVADCTRALALAPEFVVAYVNRAIAHTGLRNYQKALADYEKALALDGDNLYAAYNLGNVYIWMSEPAKAIPYYTRALSLHADFVAAYVNRGVSYNELGDYEMALKDFNRAIEINPDYSHAYYNRANVYRELDQADKAVADYNKVIELNPEHDHVYENRGDVYAASGDEAKATEDYARIITRTSAINPKRFQVARSMLMPSTPMTFLKRSLPPKEKSPEA